MSLDLSLAELPWIPAPRLKALDALGLATLGDLLTHFPRRYENRQHFDRFPGDESEQPVCVTGLVTATAAKRFGGFRKMFEATLEEENSGALSQPLVLRWYNLHWIQKAIVVGQRLVVFGKPRWRGKKLCLEHPDWEPIENDEEISIHLRRIAPIHPSGEGLSPRILRTLIFQSLEHLPELALPNEIPAALDPTARSTALHDIHFPPNLAALTAARRHLVLAEFFTTQLVIAAKRHENQALPGAVHARGQTLLDRFHGQLPFPLTGAQQRAIAEIHADLAEPRPMNRLLHGEVGSGKTIVAMSAMLLAVEAGFQAAIMAPTQILAEQHYLNFQRWLEPLGVTVALRTGARKEAAAPLPLFAPTTASKPADSIRAPSPQVTVGTHALLYEGGAEFSRLGFVVIDEQHKFGVLQRARLLAQGVAPDVLVMSATPIPRTLTMTLYGDLDVSVLDELPADRGAIRTVARPVDKLPEVIKFLREQLERGRQAYVVYPLIEETGKLNAKAAAAEFARWQEQLAPFRCALLHGRIPPEEKEPIMESFRAGATQALIATTVIEVGVDVPNATVMLIENAERFGLAQLHQLRGRIGRGAHKSYCILLTSDPNPAALEKLQILEQTADGFRIAEKDLELRGPGDLLGTAQTGLPPLKLGDPTRDRDLMQLARQEAIRLFRVDPELRRPENQRFRQLLVEARNPGLSQVS